MNNKNGEIKELSSIVGGKSRKYLTVILICLLFYTPSFFAYYTLGEWDSHAIYACLVLPTIYVSFFCLNYFVIIDRTIFSEKRRSAFYLYNLGLYIVSAAVILLFNYLSHKVNMAPPPPHEMHIPHKHHELIPGMNQMRFMEMFLRDSMLAFLSIALAYALKFGERAGEIRSEMLEIKAESRSLEIRNLKAQLNPHFLFNTLNNIYALIAFDSERAQKAVHDLGSMLRFMIYESPASVVPLSNDVAFVKDYIALMQLRLNSAMKLNVDIRTDGMEGLSIAPLILMTIIENAFKHAGISSSGKQFISISITMTSEYELCCKVINSYNDASPVDEEKSAKSIGLKNVSRQLALLYPGRSKLDITTENGIYSTELMINLSSQNLLH